MVVFFNRISFALALVLFVVPAKCVFSIGFKQASKQVLEQLTVRDSSVFEKIDAIATGDTSGEITDDVYRRIIEDASKYRRELGVVSVESLAFRCIYLFGLAYENINPGISIKIYEFLSSCNSLTENVEARFRYAEMLYFRYPNINGVAADEKEYSAYLLEDLVEQVCNGKIILSSEKMYILSDILGAIYCGEGKPDDAINLHLLTMKTIESNEKESLFLFELTRKIDHIKELKVKGVF